MGKKLFPNWLTVGEWVKWQDIKYYLEEEYLAGYDRGWAERGEAEGIINE